MSTITTLKPLVLAIMLASLAAWGGGGDDAPSPQVTPTPTPTPTPVLDTQEAAAIKDDVAVYAVEKNQVLKATVTTTDTSTWTFADVNNDADDSDANVPEIDAHFVIDGFADDGKAKNATLRLRGHSTLGVAWLVIVAAEMLTGGIGLGFWVWDEWNNLNVEHIIIAIFVVGIVGLLLEQALILLAKRFSYES